MLVFVPLSAAELADWADSGARAAGIGHAVTPALRDAFGFAATDDEDAEHTALHVAGLAGLLAHGVRLVAVAEASGRPVPDSDFGEVLLGELPWAAVTALFSDDAPEQAAGLAGAVGAADLTGAWDDTRVADFLAEHELLWHGPGEWAALV